MPKITIEGLVVTNDKKSKLVKEIVAKVSEIINVPEEDIITIIKEDESLAQEETKK